VRADVALHEKEIVDELLQLLAIPNVAATRPTSGATRSTCSAC
jgi:hypothetical protein